MKVFHRIRCHLIVLLVMLHCATAASPPSADFSKCVSNAKMICMAHHKDCFITGGAREEYEQFKDAGVVKNDCKRYLTIEVTRADQVEIEFRDDKFDKIHGVDFSRGASILFSCKNNIISSTEPKLDFSKDSYPQYDKLYCKFYINYKPGTDSSIMGTFLIGKEPTALVGKISGAASTIKSSFSYGSLEFPCDWSKALFTANKLGESEVDEVLELQPFNSGKTCPAGFFNRYSKDSTDWEIISEYICQDGAISTRKKSDSSVVNLDFDGGFTKCSRPRCAACECKFCSTNSSVDPQFVPSDGNSCAMIKCNNTASAKMLVTTSTGTRVLHNDTLECKLEPDSAGDWKSKWGEYGTSDEVTEVSCTSQVECTKLNPIVSNCPEPKICRDGEGCKECTNATLKNDGTSLCGIDNETYYTPQKANGQEVKSVTCDITTGKWEITKLDNKTETASADANVYCLKKIKATGEAKKDDSKPMSAGTLLLIVVGAALLLIVVVLVVVFCSRHHFKRKGNRVEMKSVSVTGKKSKKLKGKKGSTSTASSEISVPAPPTCPDSLTYAVEPDPPLPPPSGGTPSSGGPASAPVVGPDTGKPDKPAELIDIKPESEKKRSEKEKSTKKDPEPSVAVTVTGTSFDKSGVGSVKNTKDATDTRKDKNGESVRSDTGRHTKEETKKKEKKKPIRGKDGEMKVQLDKNGQGLTDDDDFNIDEGAKPVNAVDKNKKPYKPKDDPRKKMINVTLTEDEDGKFKPRVQSSLF